MTGRSAKGLAGAVGLAAIASVALLARPTIPSHGHLVTQSVLRQRLSEFLRAKFGIPDTDPITMGPLQSSQNPAYYECMVTVTEGQKHRSQPLSISKTGRYLALTPMFYLGANTDADLVSDARTYYKVPSSWNITVGPLERSAVPNFLQASVGFQNGSKKSGGTFYVTSDKHYGVLGSVYILRSPREVESLINTENQPYSGGADAPVTIVEYADLECPTCARLQPFLENQVLPKYGNKVKVIYKDFPLPPRIHPWSHEAAIASQCAYQIDPAAFARYRTSIFAQQEQINVANVHDKLLQLADDVGIDRLKLAACLDSQASLPRVEADLREGKELQVDETPTCFINGRMIVGFQPAENFYKLIDQALGTGR